MFQKTMIRRVFTSSGIYVGVFIGQILSIVLLKVDISFPYILYYMLCNLSLTLILIILTTFIADLTLMINGNLKKT
jgi:hypothetical protein